MGNSSRRGEASVLFYGAFAAAWGIGEGREREKTKEEIETDDFSHIMFLKKGKSPFFSFKFYSLFPVFSWV